MSARRDALLAVWGSSAQLLETTLALAADDAAVPVVRARDGIVEVRSSLRPGPAYWDGEPWEAVEFAVLLIRAALDAVGQTVDDQEGPRAH